MAQTQEQITLQGVAVQITDGTNNAFIQSATTSKFSIAVGDTAPTINNSWQSVHEVSVNAPVKLWACNQSTTPIDIKVSKY